ncbi:MAG: hypothetical protein JEZ05_08965 [Tenericutes bacterium]|nr:hypothetical protein [Mycoplasmatota bacterium]
MAGKRKYAFSEIEQYREYLEIKNLRGKNKIASGVFLVLMIFTIAYMILANYKFLEIFPIAFGYFLLLAANFVFTSYGELNTTYLKMNKYISTLGMFSMATALIIYFQSPSVIPLLFIAYSICAIYQDISVMIISDIYFLFSLLMIVFNYPDLLLGQNTSNGYSFSIILFSVLFLLMLSISAYIIMKEKSFFHNQISTSKEIEHRNISLLLKLKHKTNKEDKEFLSYYDRTNEFLQAFSDKLEIPNIFEEKIQILKLLESGTEVSKILKDFSDYSVEDIDGLKILLVNKNNEISRISEKISKTKNVDIKKREIFSATHFKSFNKQTDSTEIKIIAFVIFYVTLKKGYLGMFKIDDEHIFNTITNSDYYYYIDSRVMKIYEENSEVFDAIISDAFGKGGIK